MKLIACLLATVSLALCRGAGDRRPIPFVVKDAAPDRLKFADLRDVQLSGWLGHRVDLNETKRLKDVDLKPLLAGYHSRPGVHPWIGEHIGKWLHAATLAWAYTGDAKLKQKLDGAARELVATQESDGYLGTYAKGQRFGLFPGADWDVWSHKYNLIGLETYYRYTGWKPALTCCRRMGDLLIGTFGPGKKSILSAGTHMGMAATSVLEPVVGLYKLTGDSRYLGFAKYVVQAWDEPGGPKILSTLLITKQVSKTANGKAYEMLSNLVGLCELYRVTGESSLLHACLNAWTDIVGKRMYLTGSTSRGEVFGGDYDLPNRVSDSIAETCVTTTWIQFNMELLAITAQAKFEDQIERSAYNHLAAAQSLNGEDWCYYTPLEGRKPYDKAITCCHSSGPRALALLPQTSFATGASGAMPILYVGGIESSSGTFLLSGKQISVRQTVRFAPRWSEQIQMQSDRQVSLQVWLRLPIWLQSPSLSVNGKRISLSIENGWVLVPLKSWKGARTLSVEGNVLPMLVKGSHGNLGKSALTWGPFVMAYDEAFNPTGPRSNRVSLTQAGLKGFKESATQMAVAAMSPSGRCTAVFVPFADAGSTGSGFRVWLSDKLATSVGTSLLVDGTEIRSRKGNVEGSILEGSDAPLVVTFDGTLQREAWFGVTLQHAVQIKRVVFDHGHTFHDGGWFNTQLGKPKVQIQSTLDGDWLTVGTLDDYPSTTQSSPGTLSGGGLHSFSLVLPSAVSAYGVRVIGAAASGDDPRQSFASCGGLRAYGK